MWQSRSTQVALQRLARSCPPRGLVRVRLPASSCSPDAMRRWSQSARRPRLLPDEYRMPIRTAGQPLNFASLTRPPGGEYLLGADDVLEVTIPDLYEGGPMTPMRVRVMPDGQISLPLVGGVRVDGMTISQAQVAIADRYAQGYLVQPRVIVFLADRAKVRVLGFR